MGSPQFLFEAAIISFKKGKIADAKRFILRTYFSNIFLIDKFFLKLGNRPSSDSAKSFQYNECEQKFHYRFDNEDLLEFSQWLKEFSDSNDFIAIKDEHDIIEKQLETEPVGPTRSRLVERLYKLV